VVHGYPRVDGASGRPYEVIQAASEGEAWRVASEAMQAGLQNVAVVRRPASHGAVWGYRFTARPATSLWVVGDANGRWLSEEWAANSVEALAIYHATGGIAGVVARCLPEGSALARASARELAFGGSSPSQPAMGMLNIRCSEGRPPTEV